MQCCKARWPETEQPWPSSVHVRWLSLKSLKQHTAWESFIHWLRLASSWAWLLPWQQLPRVPQHGKYLAPAVLATGLQQPAFQTLCKRLAHLLPHASGCWAWPSPWPRLPGAPQRWQLSRLPRPLLAQATWSNSLHDGWLNRPAKGRHTCCRTLLAPGLSCRLGYCRQVRNSEGSYLRCLILCWSRPQASDCLLGCF